MNAATSQKPSTRETDADAIVIGAGANGLACAALLAKQGLKVVVVEARENIGGLAQPVEFHPGYQSGGLLHDTTILRPWIVETLSLVHHGLRLRQNRPDVLALGEPGKGLLLSGDRLHAAGEIATLSERDADAYLEFCAFLDRLRPILAQFFDQPPLDLIDTGLGDLWAMLRQGLSLRKLGRKGSLELARLMPMCVGDWLDEWFETDLLKAALALPAVAGTFTGPRSPGTNANLLMHEAAAGPGLQAGAPALIRALEKSARASGTSIRTNTRVSHLLTDGKKIEGVMLDSGEELRAPVVASSADPKTTLLKLLPAGALPRNVEEALSSFRTRGTTGQVLLAVDREVAFACEPRKAIAHARTGTHILDIERAYDAVKYREVSQTPILDIHIPTVERQNLAPKGHTVISVLVHFVPHNREGGWDDSARKALGDQVVTQLEAHAPGLEDAIVARDVLTPVDIETRYGTTGGHIHHGEHALDQLLVRPAPGCNRYATPIDGLYLCGSGSHPGGGLTCAPGALAATAISRA